MFIELTDADDGKKFLAQISHISIITANEEGGATIEFDDDYETKVKETYAQIVAMLNPGRA
jgi:hypothetical protein